MKALRGTAVTLPSDSPLVGICKQFLSQKLTQTACQLTLINLIFLPVFFSKSAATINWCDSHLFWAQPRLERFSHL